MANGFLSQLAAARAGGQATGSLAGLQIRRTGLGEMRTIEDEIRTMEEKLAEEDESGRKREGRRGRGRLGGGLLGAFLVNVLTGGAATPLLYAAGAGAGSAAGQEIGSRYSISGSGIKSRKRYLDKIRSGLDSNEGMFFKGKRKDVDLKRNKINKFLKDADRQFDQRILESSITDALTAFSLSGGKLTDIFGKEGAKNVGASSVTTDSMKKSLFGKNPILPKVAAEPKFQLGGYSSTKAGSLAGINKANFFKKGKLGFGNLRISDAVKLFKGTPLAPLMEQTPIPDYLKALPDYSFINNLGRQNNDDILGNILGGIK